MFVIKAIGIAKVSKIPLLFSKSRMIPVQGLPEKFAVEMGVDLGGGDTFMPQHFLDGPEVGAAFDEMSGEGMAKGVRGYVFVDAGETDQVF
jgi:hypothetical protein